MKHTEYPYQSTTYEDKSPEEIEREINETRAELTHTLHALERKFSPGQWVDQTLGYFRGAGEESGEFATNLGRSIKHNPLPVTLLGVGLGWLMLAGSERPERRYSRTYGESGVIPSTSGGTTARTHGEAIVTPSGAPATSTTESGGGRKEQVRQTAHEARERAEHLVHEARERMGETAHRARERAGHMAHGAREQMGEVTEAAHYQAERARQGFNHMLYEQPLVLGAVGIILGAALGAALPPTRKEDAWMGRKRDEALERAEAMGKEGLHKAEQVAEAAQKAAREEAERQNLTPSQVKQKSGQVAEAAREAAKEEAKHQDLGGASSSPSGRP
ncbi:DUF3618 domain-containing protein [Nitrosococcus wardiae]|uniref:DUF3618 domain-containing protein n=1 Tax=Nitrosococcus wardiae TaxID=1814290 RepID=A0A4P7C2L2_9GAMM|nr:DUF3618 domain-containing protein [Nitrosococcus wardiae]QBQ55754.1 DUF3618 domain-containing protein [Nitrosococcus wardiae]